MRANSHGRSAEDAIADCLTRHRCVFDRQVTIGTSIYGTALRADFVVHNLVDWPKGIVIECKWQDTGGTADEKFPYLVANIEADAYGLPVIVVVYGGGFRPGALAWLRNQVSGFPFVSVLSFDGFLSWLNRHGDIHMSVAQ